MNHNQLESIIPGETVSRKDALENMRRKIKENYDIDTEPVSFHDMECMWLRARLGNKYHNICSDSIWDFERQPVRAKKSANYKRN